MKIISYNINGLRAAIKKGFLEWVKENQADVICLQEVKIQQIQFPLEGLNELGYYHYWFFAQKKGYSGVGILSKKKPLKITYGLGIDYMDEEGRNIRIDFEECSIMSLYIPSGSNMEKRLNFKLDYMKDFYVYIKELKERYPDLILVGDYNICHKAIDIHDPIRNANQSGFLPIERKWLDDFINLGFIDSFRYKVKEPHHYSWWSYRMQSRMRNKGWRIDYALVSDSLKSKIKQASLLHEAHHSDHCPVYLEMDFS